MDILILVLLSLAGVLLLVLELFLIPGMGIAGIAGGACLVGAVVYAYMVLPRVWLCMRSARVTQ